MQGTGNDFVMVDLNTVEPGQDFASLARFSCDRRFGVGADGLITAGFTPQMKLEMRMYNPDGSESEMCGNGIRCFAKFVVANGMTLGPGMDVLTGAGLLRPLILEDGRVKVDMGKARLTRGEIGLAGEPSERFVDEKVSATPFKGTAVSMGNPHLVIFGEDIDAIDLATVGPELERHRSFPNRTNVHFVEVVSRTHLRMRTWERGAGITLACGTGACSVAVAGFLNGLSEREVRVTLPGGDLTVVYSENGTVWMTGPAETVYTGVLDWPSVAAGRS